MKGTDYLFIVFLQAVTTVLVWYVASYTKEKGKNLATREDIHEITRQIESAKIEYAKELEGLKNQLNAKFHAHTLKLNKEFQCLQEVWSALLDLQCLAEKVFLPEQEDPQRGDERFHDLMEGVEQFHTKVKKYKPFYPENIYAFLTITAIWQSHELFNKERLLQKTGNGAGISEQEGEVIMKEFGRCVNTVGDKIRDRLQSY